MFRLKKIYKWEGFTSSGELLKGTSDLLEVNNLRQELQKKGILIKKIEMKSTLVFNKKILSKKEIFLLNQELMLLLKAQVAFPTAIEMLISASNKRARNIFLESIRDDLKEGISISVAFHRHKNYYSQFFLGLIQIGDETKQLPIILSKIVEYQKKIQKINTKIKKALFYPILVISLTFLILIGMFVWIIPQFENFYQNAGAKLPLATQFLLYGARNFNNYLIIFLISATFLTVIIYGIAKKNPSWLYKMRDKGLLKIPFIGLKIKKAILARFSYTLSIGLKAGLSLPEALSLSAKTIKNISYKEAFYKLQRELVTGENFGKIIERNKLFLDTFVNFIKSSQGTNHTIAALENIEIIFSLEVEDFLDHLSTLLEPLLIVFLGIVIGAMLVAMYLPIFKLGSIV